MGGCFSLEGIKDFLIWLVLVCLVVALLRLLLPILLGWLGVVLSPLILRIINMIIVAVVLIFLIIVIFDLAECFLGGAGMGFGRRVGMLLYHFASTAKLA
jgi:hypothetical protein